MHVRLAIKKLLARQRNATILSIFMEFEAFHLYCNFGSLRMRVILCSFYFSFKLTIVMCTLSFDDILSLFSSDFQKLAEQVGLYASP